MTVFKSEGGIAEENQVRSVAWKLAEAQDKEKTIDPTDLRVPVMLKALYTFEVWLRVCFIGPPISTSINTATANNILLQISLLLIEISHTIAVAYYVWRAIKKVRISKKNIVHNLPYLWRR